MAPVIIWIISTFNIFGISHWFRTHPQYNGKVTLTEMYDSRRNFKCGVSGYPDSIDCPTSTISAVIPNTSVTANAGGITYGDKLGNTYVMVEVRRYGMYVSEVCKVYKVEGNNLSLVRNLPNDLWCNMGMSRGMVTDYKGNWFVMGMTNGGDTSDVYKIDGTSALYVPEFQSMPRAKFFYNTDEGGSLYVGTDYGKYYKVTFTP